MLIKYNSLRPEVDFRCVELLLLMSDNDYLEIILKKNNTPRKLTVDCLRLLVKKNCLVIKTSKKHKLIKRYVITDYGKKVIRSYNEIKYLLR